MSYLRKLDAWLSERLSEDGLLDERLYKLDEAKITETKRAIKEKILASHRNGQKEYVKRFSALVKEMLGMVAEPPKKQRKKNGR